MFFIIFFFSVLFIFSHPSHWFIWTGMSIYPPFLFDISQCFSCPSRGSFTHIRVEMVQTLWRRANCYWIHITYMKFSGKFSISSRPQGIVNDFSTLLHRCCTPSRSAMDSCCFSLPIPIFHFIRIWSDLKVIVVIKIMFWISRGFSSTLRAIQTYFLRFFRS